MRFPWIERSRLWLVLDRHAAAPRELPEVTALAIAGGVDAILCRIKDLPPAEAAPIAAAVRKVCRKMHTPFVMSHLPELAVELQADGVQLGVADPGIAQVRELVGGDMAIGFSTHGVGEAARCFENGADYVFLGPIFATPEKLKYGAPLGIDIVHQAAQLPGPVVLIGGISQTNVSEVLAHGGTRVAAISALQSVDDPLQTARGFASLLKPMQ